MKYFEIVMTIQINMGPEISNFCLITITRFKEPESQILMSKTSFSLTHGSVLDVMSHFYICSTKF